MSPLQIDRQTRDKLIAEHPSSAEVIKPLLRGRDVKRWSVESVDLYLLFIPWHFPLHQDSHITGVSEKAEQEFKKRYPAIYNHLLRFKTELSARNKAETGIRYEWYALQRYGSNYWEEFEKPKIIYPNICKRNEFAWDESGYYTNQKAFIIPCNDKTLLAILNSSVMTFLFDKLLPKLQGDFYEPSSIFMKDFPIPTATEAKQKAIETLVGYVLYLTATLKNIPSSGDSSMDKLMTRYFEQIIDAVVMELYLPEELHEHNTYFMPHLLSENLPNIDTIKGDRIETLRENFNRLFDKDHPIRVGIFFLDSIPVVRTIRGLK